MVNINMKHLPMNSQWRKAGKHEISLRSVVNDLQYLKNKQTNKQTITITMYTK